MRKILVYLFWSAVIVAGLQWARLYHYLLFHSIAEVFSIVIACGIFMIAWNSRQFLDNNYLLLLGIAYLFVGAIDFVHTLAYRGMGVFVEYKIEMASQLWIAARYLESLSFIIASLFMRRAVRIGLVFAGYTVAVVLVFLAIFSWQIFPLCFVEGTGLTPFKKVSEYVVCLILAASIASLIKNRDQFDRTVLRWLIWAMAITIASEMSFTLYLHPYSLANVVGHYLKILSFYFIYKAVIETGLKRPYHLLFRNLQQSEERYRLRTIELQQLAASLEERVQKRTNELNRAHQELQNFTLVASHDMQEPLRKIQVFSTRLKERYSATLEEDIRDCLTRIEASAGRMQALLEAMLEYFRIARTHYLSAVDLTPIVQKVVADLKDVIEESHADIEIGRLPVMAVDSRQMYQLFQKLLHNSLKYRKAGEKPMIRIYSEISDNRCRILVEDNGIGFDEKYLDRLFRPLQRLHVPNYEGLGMGLAISQKIVEQHHGEITARSSPGKGATFIITLPLGADK